MGEFSSKTLTEIRRDLHAHPEPGWKEFRTTALVAEELDRRGFTLHLGDDAVATGSRMGIPSADEIDTAIEQSRREGAPTEYVDQMDGITGLVAEKVYGDGTGPTVGVRIDMDALEQSEATEDDHRPAREGFASRHPNEMHACGHDGHTAIGMGLGRELDEQGGFDGTLKLFFQPAEEGSRGGKAMSETEHLADVEYFLSLHLGLGNETGTVIAAYERPLANTRLRIVFSGEPSHAGSDPSRGRNTLQAAATAIQNLYAIPRHGDGITRINVGQVRSPNPRNVIADECRMEIEVRGGSTELNEYMLNSARRVIEHAAGMHGVETAVEVHGKAVSFTADEPMVRAVSAAAGTVDAVSNVVDRAPLGGSEDASYLIRRVQETGGEATYIGIGASNPSGHHTARFDIDEDALAIGVDVVAETIRGL